MKRKITPLKVGKLIFKWSHFTWKQYELEWVHFNSNCLFWFNICVLLWTLWWISACDACPAGYSTAVEGAVSIGDCGEVEPLQMRKTISPTILWITQELVHCVGQIICLVVCLQPLTHLGLSSCFGLVAVVLVCPPGSVEASDVHACVLCGKGEYWRWISFHGYESVKGCPKWVQSH